MSGRARLLRRWMAVAAAGALYGCSGIQSALEPAGPNAREIAALWWVMAGGGALIFIVVLAALLYALYAGEAGRRRIRPVRLIILGGIALPVVVLSTMVPFNLTVSSGVSAPAPPDTLTVWVDGRQWWWDVEYEDEAAGGRFATANEIYLPVGIPVELMLTSSDVIHSFWVPRLAGKLDLIPGQTNRMMIQADEPGRFRGQCAEFCGLSHAKMAFYVVAVEPKQFARWLEQQRQPAAPPEDPLARRGAELFAASGCALCHTVRGHGAWGQAGPDLTHVGSRLTIGAGTLENHRENLALWIAHNSEVKPGNRMPDYDDLELDARRALGAYLEGLQ